MGFLRCEVPGSRTVLAGTRDKRADRQAVRWKAGTVPHRQFRLTVSGLPASDFLCAAAVEAAETCLSLTQPRDCWIAAGSLHFKRSSIFVIFLFFKATF